MLRLFLVSKQSLLVLVVNSNNKYNYLCTIKAPFQITNFIIAPSKIYKYRVNI